MKKIKLCLSVLLLLALLITSMTACSGPAGEQGLQGVQGEQGPAGEQGSPGEKGDGIASISKTNTEGLLDTYTIIYTNGETTTFTVTNGSAGEQGIQGIQGEKGADGHTPVITIQNGNWYIDGVDTGKSADGIKGDTGNSISAIVKTSTEGLVDTYTITFTNGTTTTFTVTNGADGADGAQGIQGIKGEKGEDGHTPIITIQNGNWYIDGADTGKSADGIKGDTGNGVSKIEKTGTEGLVDTYTITYTNGDTTTFTVTNGAQGQQGIQGIQGVPGKDGETPVITIKDGYWYINGVNTTQSAAGLKGDTGNGISKIEKTGTEGLVDTYTITYTNGDTTTFTVTNGAQGQQGIQGIQGKPGEDGKTPVITIQNGNWYIDGTDSGKSAEGIKGDTGNGISKIEKTGTEGLVDTYTITYTNGDTTTFTVTNGAQGEQGIQGIQGVPGKDGETPVITIKDGYWYINGVNTTQSAAGLKGDTGNGISSIAKTGTEGLVDTYTITYTNGDTTTFTVTNGAQGEQGIQGVPGKDGSTPTITIQDGYWYINGVNTNQSAVGVKGDDGLSAFETYQKYHPEYTGTEAEWIESLKGSDGAQGEQGVSVINAYIDAELHLWIELSNGTKIDAGYVGVNTNPPAVTTYTVTFKDWNGTVLKTQDNVVSGTAATAPTAPTRDGYTFMGWNVSFDNITSDLIVTAIYESTSPQLIISTVEANVGDATATVTISVKNNPGILGASFTVTYDSDLTLTSVSKGTALSTLTFTKPGTLSNPCNFGWDGVEADDTNGDIVTLTFDISSITTTGTFEISVSYNNGDIFDDNIAPITFELVEGAIILS